MATASEIYKNSFITQAVRGVNEDGLQPRQPQRSQPTDLQFNAGGGTRANPTPATISSVRRDLSGPQAATTRRQVQSRPASQPDIRPAASAAAAVTTPAPAPSAVDTAVEGEFIPASRRRPGPTTAPNGVDRTGRIASNSASGLSTIDDPSRGNIVGLESGRTVALGDAARNPVNYVDFAGANQEFARANAIRQRAVDAQPRGAGVVVPQTDPVQDVLARAERLTAQAQNTNNGDRSVLLRSAQGLRDSADTLAQIRGQDVRQQGALELARANNGFTLDEISARGDIDRGNIDRRGAIQLAVQQLQNEGFVDSQRARASGASASDRTDALFRLVESGLFGPEDAELQQDVIAELLSTIGLADGGMVPSARSYADGGLIGGTTRRPVQPELVGYQRYARSAMEQGLTPVGFEQFLSLQSGAANRNVPVGMADGGEVPGADASGKMVVDTDPNAPTDSIPAMIDGQQPAKLDSGEFVIPRDVVMFFGTDKLQKMIAQARKPADGGQSTAPGVSAISAAQGQ